MESAPRILILEDNPADARLMVLALEESGLAFEWQAVAEKGDFLAALKKEPDVVLADLHLPRYGALEALETVRSRGLDLPFIILTGLSEGPSALEAIRLGAADYLGKDDLGRLRFAVDRALAEKRFRQRHAALQERCRTEEARFREFIQGTDDLVIQVDAEGRFLFVNPQAEKYLGMTPEECVGRLVFDVVHPEDRRRTEEAFAGWVRAGAPRGHFDNRVVSRTGEVFRLSWTINIHYDATGAPAYLFSFARDVGDQKILERELQTALEENRSIIEASPAAIFTLDPDGRVRGWNTSAERVFGWRAEEAVGHPNPIVPAESQDEFRVHLKQLLAGATILQKEVICRTKDGRTIPISLSAAPLHDSRGNTGGVMCLAFDITRRKEAERRLRLQVKENRAFFENQAVGAMQLGLDWRFERVNDRYCQITGYPREELLGRSPLDIIHPEDRQQELTMSRPFICGETSTYQHEKRYLCKDGKTVWVLTSAALVRGEQGKPQHIVGLVQDISELKRSEQELRKSEEHLKRAQQIAHLGSYAFDPAENTHSWSDELFRIFGVEQQGFEPSFDAFFEAVHPEDRARLEEAYAESLLPGQAGFELEYRVVCRATGEIRWLHDRCENARDASGEVIRSIGMVQDITERKRYEDELQRVNRTLRVISRCNETMVRAAAKEDLVAGILRQLVEAGGYPLALTWLPGTDRDDFAPAVYPERAGRCLNGSKGKKCGLVRHLLSVCRTPYSREVPLSEAVLGKDACCRTLFEEFGVRSAFSLALDVQEEHIGCLILFSAAEGFYSEEVYLLKELADDLAYGIRSLRTESAHRQAREMLRLRNRAIEASVNGVMISEARLPDTPLLYVNEAFERITGYRAEEVLGRDPRFLAGPDQDQKALVDIRHALRAGRPVTALVRNYRKDGSLFWNDLSVAPVCDEAGEVTHFVSIINDVSYRQAYEEELARRSNFDELTGLANRNLLDDRLEQALAHARRCGEKLALFLLDLDRFQVINDSLGHSQGNELLRLVAARLQGAVRAQDTLARLGGDEFLILFQDVRDHDGLVSVVEKIRAVLAPPYALGSRSLQVTASLGISLFPEDGQSGEMLIRNADLAMYRAKEEGRDAFRFFTPDLDVRVVETLDLEADLRRALENREFLLHFQPKVDVGNNRIVGGEALVRWRHPRRGMVSPGAFIPLAEETGLIDPLGRWVLEEVCRVNRAFQERGLPPVPLAANVSARQFRNEKLVELVEGILAESGLAPRWLTLELTESMVMDRPEQAAETMFRLKQLGVGLSLDDFGTGYSSLNYLRRFPVDRLKIDRSFISEVAVDPGAAAVAESVVAIAHNLGIKAVAEGVETEGQLAFLRACRCDVYQGFLFSRPVPAEEFAELLRVHAPAGG